MEHPVARAARFDRASIFFNKLAVALLLSTALAEGFTMTSALIANSEATTEASRLVNEPPSDPELLTYEIDKYNHDVNTVDTLLLAMGLVATTGGDLAVGLSGIGYSMSSKANKIRASFLAPQPAQANYAAFPPYSGWENRANAPAADNPNHYPIPPVPYYPNPYGSQHPGPDPIQPQQFHPQQSVQQYP